MTRLILIALMLLTANAGAHSFPPHSSASEAVTLMPTATLTTLPGTAAPQQNTALPPQQNDDVANLESDVFGAQLFTGRFAQQGPTQFNPDYLISSGDQVQVRLWGGFSFDSVLTVDPQDG